MNDVKKIAIEITSRNVCEDRNITDYSVRVLDDDVLLNGKNISYWGNERNTGCQTNYDCDTDIHKDINRLCDEIRLKFLKLRNLTK